MTELEQRIKQAAQQYYTDGSSPYTDEEFDAMVDELRQTNPGSELFRVGWGYSVDADTTPGQKYKHKYGRAGSLDKCHSWNELSWMIQHGPVDLSLKLDGISVVLYYEHGYMVRALTRGDGITGIDITDKVQRIFPSNCHGYDFTGAVRGEILMSYENFEKFQTIHPEAKNPRNSTAGIIGANDITDDLNYLSIIVYTVVGDEHIHDDWDSEYSITKIRDRLCDMFGYDRVVPHSVRMYLKQDDFIEGMYAMRSQWYNKWPADGIVITLGSLPVTAPDNNEVVYVAQAFKFPSEKKECKVVDVIWNMSKTHYAIPKIQIESTQLAGTTVSYCTGYNAKYIADNDIGPGSIVEVEKRGEIIPNVNRVIQSTYAAIPSMCPDCGQPLKWEGYHLVCHNPDCANATQQDVICWLANLAPVDGFGSKLQLKFLGNVLGDPITVERVMDDSLRKYINHTFPSAQFQLFQSMLNKLFNGRYDLTTAIKALNIPRMGDVNAAKLAQHPDAVKAIMNYHADIFLLQKLRDSVGNANIDAVMDNVDKVRRLKLIEDRIDWSAVPSVDSSEVVKVAVTGKLSVKRSDFEKLLSSKGYKVADISKDTKFLITDDPTSSSSKNKKADAWGIVKISEEEFRKQYLH